MDPQENNMTEQNATRPAMPNVSFFRFEDLRVYGKATDYAS